MHTHTQYTHTHTKCTRTHTHTGELFTQKLADFSIDWTGRAGGGDSMEGGRGGGEVSGYNIKIKCSI